MSGAPDFAKLIASAQSWLNHPSAPHASEAHGLISQLVAALTGTRITSAVQLDLLPTRSLVQVDESAAPELLGRQPNYVYFEKMSGRGWLRLDPSDREDGDTLEPSDRVIAFSTRFGQYSPRVRLLHRGNGGE